MDKYSIPDWIGVPPHGTHLDVLKHGQLLQKLSIDEKGYYYFGRNAVLCNFVLEHASCSRMHAVLLYHRALKRFAIVDLESSHGTFVENVQIDSLTVVFFNFDSTFHFGASTRNYVLRSNIGYDDRMSKKAKEESGEKGGNIMDEIDVDSVTEYNTMQNRRIPQIPISFEEARQKSKPRPKLRINDEEQIINLEDIDPNVGRFRNLVRTVNILPNANQPVNLHAPNIKKINKSALSIQNHPSHNLLTPLSTLGTGMALTAAPDLNLYASDDSLPLADIVSLRGAILSSSAAITASTTTDDENVCRKKKYVKEAWPGRRSNEML